MKSLIRKILNEYVEIEEAKIRDLVNFGDSYEGNLARQMKSHTEREFEVDRSLLNFVTLSRRFNNKKIRANLKWNDRASHSINKRIKERTSFLSITEFNDLIKSVLNYIFPDSIGGLIRKNGRYAIYLKEENITLIVNINFKEIIKGNIELYVITVLPGYKHDPSKVLDIIEF